MSKTRAVATETWRHLTPDPLRFLSRARRSGRLLLAEAGGRLTLLDPEGKTVATAELGAEPRAIAAHPDGTRYASLDRRGVLTIVDHELKTVASLPRHEEACSLDIRGEDSVIAVGFLTGNVFFLDSRGQRLSRAPIPFRPASIRLGELTFGLAVASDGGKLALYDADGAPVWSVDLRYPSGPVVASDEAGLILLPVASQGVQAYDVLGTPAGAYEPPQPADLVAVSPEGARLLVAGEKGGLFYLTREDGLCLWQESGGLRPVGIELAAGGGIAYVGHGDGTVRALRFEDRIEASEAERGTFLEIERPTGPAPRKPLWTRRLPVLSGGRFAGYCRLAPGGDHVLVIQGREGLLLSGTGRVVRTDALGGEGAGGAFGDSGKRYVLTTRSALFLFGVEEGLLAKHEMRVTSLALAGTGPAVLVADDTGEVYLLGGKGEVRWRRTMPGGVERVLLDPAGRFAGVVCADGYLYILGPDGVPLWKRKRREGKEIALLLAEQALFASPSGGLALHGYDRVKSWAVKTGLAATGLFEEGGVPFLWTADNRFYRVALGDGHLEPFDRTPNQGTSRVVPLRAGGFVEVIANGATVSAMALDGTVLWKHTVPAPIDLWNLHGAAGRVSFTAGDLLYVFSVEDEGPGEATRDGDVPLEIPRTL